MGRSLIRASEINSINSEMESFKSAVDLFNKKYNALPGDMHNAQDYWGAKANCNAFFGIPQTTTATCNGNGNGFIEANFPSTSTTGNESFLFWKHLANAELIKGNYNGISASGSILSTSTNNVPSGKIAGSLWYMSYLAINPASFYFNGTYDHTLQYGLYEANSIPRKGALTADEAFSLDSKFDDGRPGTGAMRVIRNNTDPNCTTSTLAADTFTATYNISTGGNNCALLFPRAF